MKIDRAEVTTPSSRIAPCRAAWGCILAALLLAGCGHSSDTPARIAERADVSITLDGGRHACVVALDQEQQGSTVKCGELVPFLKEELRLKPGSIYDIRVPGDFDQGQMARLAADLNGAGYRFIGGRANPLLAHSSDHH